MSTANNSPLSTLNDPLPTGYKQTEVGIIPEDWDDTFLGEITKLMTNGFVGTATSQYTEDDTGVLYIQGYNVEENSFNFRGVKFVNQTFHKAHSKSCLREGDLLTVQTGDVGLTTIVPKTMVGANCHALIISRFQKGRSNSRFISYYLNSMPGRARLKLIEVGTTMKHLNVGDMLQFKVPLPPTVAEQEAIAGALSDADALIESLEQLIAKKRRIKAGAMQTLLTGKKRLPGFSGNWKKHQLCNFGKFKNGLNKDSDSFGHGSPFVNLMDVFGVNSISSAANLGLVASTTADREIYNLNAGDVLFIRSSVKPSGVGLTAVVESDLHNTVFSGFLIRFRDDGSLDAGFKRYCFYEEKFRKKIIAASSVSANTNINQNNLGQLTILLPPTKAEQTAIAEILSDMDTEIDALEAKLRKARQIKQGMMQELLTGKTRLV
jgi:type I restriction enzyme S subunit